MKYTKLLLVSPTFYPTHGGAELRFLRYLPLLNENGINVTVITGTPKFKKFLEQDHSADWRNKNDGTLVSELEINSSNISQYKLPEKGAAERSRILLDKAIEYCNNADTKPDVIQILSPVPVKMIGRLKKIKSMGVPIVFSYALAHEFSSVSILSWLQRQKIRLVYKHFSCIIVASTVLQKLVKRIHPNVQIKVIPNGVDTEKFSPSENKAEMERLRSALGLPEQAVVICSVGAIHPRKGTDLLVKAWAALVRKVDNLHLLLIGPRFDQQRKELHAFRKDIDAAIKKSGRADNIHFAGQIDNVDEYLKASDLFVFPSKKEGMPNAVLEAMASGLPAILTPFIGLSDDLGRPGKEYLLVNRSEQSIAHGIQTMLNDNSLRCDMAKNAREWIINTMDLTKSVELHAKVYSSLAS